VKKESGGGTSELRRLKGEVFDLDCGDRLVFE
jgi:hypothetical protein